MPIKLSIEIVSPLTPDDQDLLSGIAVMTLAIANRELAKQGFPNTFPDDEDAPPPPEIAEDGHQHQWVAGTLVIEDCVGCGERRLAADQLPDPPYLPALKVN
jgi:hypothetical protein